MKKSFLMLIAVFLLTALLIGGASAAIGGSGTESDPYTINSLSDLKLLMGAGYASYAGNDKYFILTNDIINDGTFTSIGNTSYAFTGNFDGKEHTMYGLKSPLMLYLSGSVVNLNFENCYVQSANASIMAVGIRQLGTVENCRMQNCYVEGTASYVGLFFASFDSAATVNINNCNVDKCTVYLRKNSGIGYISGIYGYCTTTIANISNVNVTNTIFTKNNAYTGRICGIGYTNVTTLGNVQYNNCNVTNNYISGVDSLTAVYPIGYGSVLTQCSESGNTLTADNTLFIRLLPETSTLTNDTSESSPKCIGETVTFTVQGQQGAAIYLENNLIKSGYSFNYGDGGKQIGNTPLTVSYSSLGTKTVSVEIFGYYYGSGKVSGGTLTSTVYIDIPEKLNGSGTQSDPYQVTSDEDLHSWSNYDFFYDTAYMAILQDFTPTATVMEFNGHLNGNNHTLSNGKQPLFNKVGGTVQNLNFSDAIVNGNGLLATKSSAAVSNVNADNCFVGGSTAGGLVGTATGSFTDCTVNHITVKGTKSAGGITADGNTTVDSCHVFNSDLLAPVTYGICADTDHFTPRKYTIVWDESSSTSKNITYADDAAGMSENDRNELIKDHTHFAVVQWNGTEPEVNYYLYRDNLDYKATDESCDVSSGEPSVLTGADGDVMVLYDTVWWTTSKVGNNWYMTFTWDMDAVDNTWVSPHTYGDDLQHTSLAKYVGLGVFEGYVMNSQLRSISTSNLPTVSTTQNNFYVSATTGRNWQYNQTLPMTYAWYIMQLYFVKGNRDVQTAYGNGIVGGSVTALNMYWSPTNAWINGTTANQTTGVTALGLHNVWGNVYKFMGEMRYDTNTAKFSVLAGKDHVNIESGTASTWKSTTTAYTAGSWANVTDISGTPEYPFFPYAASGTTYTVNYADGFFSSPYTERCVYVGGNRGDGLQAGGLCVLTGSGAAGTGSTIGTRLHVVIT